MVVGVAVVAGVVVVAVVVVGVAGDWPPAEHVRVEASNGRTIVPPSTGLCATSVLIRTAPNCPAHTVELRMPDRSESAMRTGYPPPAR